MYGLSFCCSVGQKMQQVLVLGSQQLTQLRDIIKCEADANMAASGCWKPSAYFYIEVRHFRL